MRSLIISGVMRLGLSPCLIHWFGWLLRGCLKNDMNISLTEALKENFIRNCCRGEVDCKFNKKPGKDNH